MQVSVFPHCYRIMLRRAQDQHDASHTHTNTHHSLPAVQEYRSVKPLPEPLEIPEYFPCFEDFNQRFQKLHVDL
jgi:hypothetical protein